MKSKSLMIQGTSSSVGKSIITAALCRIFTQDGFDVNPFKSQNMSLNSYITYEEHEMGRAQVIQAEACKKAPSSKMNPILLKPTTDRKSQVILNGKVYKNMDAVEYFQFKPQLREMVADTYNELSDASDIVVIEGAGSPAEINLKKEDIVNMGMAKIAKAPVILVGDIDKGGVFAALAGTMLLLDEDERNLVKGVIINKFRGSLEILEPGLRQLEEIIKVPVLGVVPYFELNIEDEDSVSDWFKQDEKSERDIDIAIIRLKHISNFTDFNSLKLFQDAGIRFVKNKSDLGKPDIIIIPGTKNTIEDMLALEEAGLAEGIKDSYQEGAFVFGICGGYQMLGKTIEDPFNVESSQGTVEGLGLINSNTIFLQDKTTTLSSGYVEYFDCQISGYEIHMGQTKVEKDKPLLKIRTRSNIEVDEIDGVISEDGRIFGTYIHGIFDNTIFTRRFLNKVRVHKGLEIIDDVDFDYLKHKDQQYNELADLVREHLDMEQIYKIVENGI